jgi:hypothetical protein
VYFSRWSNFENSFFLKSYITLLFALSKHFHQLTLKLVYVNTLKYFVCLWCVVYLQVFKVLTLLWPNGLARHFITETVALSFVCGRWLGNTNKQYIWDFPHLQDFQGYNLYYYSVGCSARSLHSNHVPHRRCGRLYFNIIWIKSCNAILRWNTALKKLFKWIDPWIRKSFLLASS